LRILKLSHGYPPTISGVTLVVRKFARAMVHRGHTVRVITASESRKPYQAEDRGVQLKRIFAFPNPFWREGPIPFISMQDLKQEVAAFKPDVIHTHEGALLGNQLLRLKGEMEVPVVSSSYYLPRYVTHYLTWGSRLINNIMWKYAVWHFNQFDRVIYSTPTQRDLYIENGLQAPTTVISNGLDTNRYKPGEEGVPEVSARYNLPTGPRVIFVGRLMKDKKIDVLLEAMARVCAQHDAHLLLVGRGDEKPELQRLADERCIKDRVHFLGFVREEDLPALYRASDLFAITSISEVQSIPTLQAAATALPIVAADAAALPELVADGVNGFLVPPDDVSATAQAILRIISDPAYAESLGQASLAVGREHAEERSFERYENFYEMMVYGEP
jgi:glycosyltransferase involved in cell wall biosynthesis